MKSGQIKMAENIAVLILFIFIVVMGLMFYVGYKRNSLEAKQAERDIENAVEVASRIGFLPELQCSQDSIQQQNCIDLLKLKAVNDLNLFNSVTNRNQVYFGILRYSSVVLKQVYPIPPEDEGSYKLYEFKKEGSITKEFIPIPIIIYDPKLDESSFGVLEVTVYG